MIRQVYRIKNAGNLKEDSDMAQDKEKPIIGEILVSPIDQIVPNRACFRTQLKKNRVSLSGRYKRRLLLGHVGVFPQGVTPTSKTSACSPFQTVMQEKTQRFILVRAREGPTSSGGG